MPTTLLRIILLFACVVSTVLPGRAADSPIPPCPPRETLIERASATIKVLDRLYWSKALSIWLDRTGDDLRAHYEGRVNPPWWSVANVVESLVDFADTTGQTDHLAALASLYETQRESQNKRAPMIEELKRRGQWSEKDEAREKERTARKEREARERKPDAPLSRKAVYYSHFRNEYLDDSAWWGVAWLRMYDRTQEKKYLETARIIQEHMAKNWRPDKGGGVLWCEDEDKQKPNAITNSLFIILSARLYERTKDKTHLEWAERGMKWFRETAMYDGTAVVDAPGHRGDYWTYNQGTYLGALLAMYRATGNADYLNDAVKAAETILSKSGIVLPNGVIHEKLGTSGWDPGMFKGVFVRYLGQMRDLLIAEGKHPELVAKIRAALRNSTASLLTFGAGTDGQYSISWQEGGKDQSRNFNTQASAFALFIATIEKADR